MRVFLVTFILVYGLLHLYFLGRARNALQMGRWPVVGLSGFLLLMLLAPISVRLLEQRGLERAAMVMAWSGYVWMGFVFLFVVFSLVFDAGRIGVGVIRKICGRRRLKSRGALSARNVFLIPLTLALLVVTYGFFENQTIRTEEIRLTSPKLTTGETIRLVQISDVHLGIMIREKRLAKILAAVRAAQPDILVATGDLVDGQLDNISGLAQQFAVIRPKYGKYAVTGNHELYAGLDQSLAFIAAGGFQLLRGSNQLVTNHLAIAGLDDLRAMAATGNLSEETETLAGLAPGRFNILLKHRPLVEQGALGLIDLQLSGHTHAGQIFPFSLATRLAFPWHCGLYELKDGRRLYVSRGAGTWGPPIRFLSPPQITVLVLSGG